MNSRESGSDEWREHEWTITSDGPLDDEVEPVFPDPPQLDRYQNLQMLGAGAMGEVWLVRDRELQREVALKISRGNDAQTAGQFALEAQITSQLDHPSIPPVYDVGFDRQYRPFITSKLIRGHQPLSALIERFVQHDEQAEHEFGFAHRAQIVLQVANALDYAHERGVVHQDVKPENVVMGRFGEVYLLDWGLATVSTHSTAEPVRVAGSGADEIQARGSWVVGTPLYMSPEQFAGETADARNDVYSLCAVLYELLALRHYLTEAEDISTEDAFGAAMKTHVPPSPSDLYQPDHRPPPELSALSLKGLSKDVESRFQSAGEFREALQEWLDTAH